MIPASLTAVRMTRLFVTVFLYWLQTGHGKPERARRFLRPSALNKEYVVDELMSELKSHAHEERIEQLKEILRPMYAALPQLPDGTLGHTVMRYALHRLLAKADGWFVIGLEPDRDGTNMSVSSIKTQMEWAPSYLQEVLESSHQGRGVSMHEVAVLATTLEDLAHKEALGRLDAIYDIYEFDKAKRLTEEQFTLILDTFSLVYFKGGNWTAQTSKEARARIYKFTHNPKQTPRLKPWLTNLSEAALSDIGERNYTFALRVVEDIGKDFGRYNQPDCTSLKENLISMEDRMPGRVLLSDFYAKGLHSQWKFTEKLEYLRDLGALDEADPGKPRVIVPNYVTSRSQCLASSGLYANCCPNECEALMEQLELAIEEPEASVKQVRGLVEKLSSPTVEAPRVLSESLLSRLESVATANGGRIPLHGRLFAQWMHNAFPRECSFPHTTGTTSPQTPDEWMQNTGHSSTQASEEEMVCHVSGPCAGGASMASSSAQAELQSDDLPVEIPWSDAEELLDGHARRTIGSAFAQISNSPKASLQERRSFSNVLRTFAILGTAIGIAFSFKVPLNQACGMSMKSVSMGRTWAPRVLFIVPMVILTVGLVFDASYINDFFLCSLCWGLAALVYLIPAALPHQGDDGSWKEKCAV